MNSKEIFKKMQDVVAVMMTDGELWCENKNKAAGARVRKATLALAKLGKDFRKTSVLESKK